MSNEENKKSRTRQYLRYGEFGIPTFYEVNRKKRP